MSERDEQRRAKNAAFDAIEHAAQGGEVDLLELLAENPASGLEKLAPHVYRARIDPDNRWSVSGL